MAYDPCEPCACDPAKTMGDPLSARYTVARIMCAILAQLQEGIIVTPGVLPAPTATQTLAPVTGVVSTVLAANAARVGGWVRNIGATTIFVRFGAGATIILPTALAPGDSLLFAVGGPVYTGIVTAITAGAAENLEVTELV